MSVKYNNEARNLLSMLGNMSKVYQDAMSETSQVMVGNSKNGVESNALLKQHLNLNFLTQKRYPSLSPATIKNKKSNKILNESGDGMRDMQKNTFTKFVRGLSIITARFPKAFYMKDHNYGKGIQKKRQFFSLDIAESKLMGKIYENMLVLFINKKGVKAK